jgi:poly(3-hydroxybutyrate) depolymerase
VTESGVYDLQVQGQARPVWVQLPDAAAGTQPAALVIDLHSAGLTTGVGTDLLDQLGLGGAVVVSPRANDSPFPSWSESDTFNVEYMRALWDALGRSLCFDAERVVLSAVGQGTLVASEAVCGTDIPFGLVIQVWGLVPVQECEPSRAVAMVSLNTFDPSDGSHWDGRWEPPVPREVAVTGGIGPVPDDLDQWAQRYHCTDTRSEQTIADPGDVLARDSVLFSYNACDAPLAAFGLTTTPAGGSVTAMPAFEGLAPQLQQIVDDVLAS